MIKKPTDAIAPRLDRLESLVADLTIVKNDDLHDINEILTDVARLKDSVEVIRERHAEAAMNQKEMIQSVTLSLKEFGMDFKIGMKELSSTVAQKFDTIEPRIQQLEQHRWKYSGAIGLLVFIMSVGMIVVAKYLPLPQYQTTTTTTTR